MPGSSLTVPTVYSVMAAAATIARPGSAVTRARMPAAAAASRTDRAHCDDGRRFFALDVRHAEAAADRQLVEVEPLEERRDHVDRLMEEIGDEDLAADVEVHAGELDRRAGSPARLDGLGRIARRDAETELRVDLTGADELVRVRLDARA